MPVPICCLFRRFLFPSCIPVPVLEKVYSGNTRRAGYYCCLLPSLQCLLLDRTIMVVPVQKPILCACSCSGTEVRALSDRGGGGGLSPEFLFVAKAKRELD